MTKVEAIKTFKFNNGTDVILAERNSGFGKMRNLYKKIQKADGVDSFELIGDKSHLNYNGEKHYIKSFYKNEKYVGEATISIFNKGTKDCLLKINLQDPSMRGYLELQGNKITKLSNFKIKDAKNLTPMAKRFLKLLGRGTI